LCARKLIKIADRREASFLGILGEIIHRRVEI
jgi:hypothetical protein